MKRAWRILWRVFLGLFIILGGLLLFFTVTEYRPAPEESLSVAGSGIELSEGETISLLSWNIGFGGLGDNADFFMDGGKSVQTADKNRVEKNLHGILATLQKKKPDILFLQEVDQNSDRTFHIDETKLFREAFPDYESSFAYNLKAFYIPYPIPPLGSMGSGIMTLSKYSVTDAKRIQLPCPFKWPVSVFNLKRCLMIDRVKAGDRELVLINLHLEAYDDGEGKIAQANMLREIMEAEAAKGNYVIAGGDFNQTFSNVDTSAYEVPDGQWTPGTINISDYTSKWMYLMDGTVPSCRSLAVPYAGADKESFQYYCIDGFIVSDNIQLESFEVIDEDFRDSDHNPVCMTFRLI